MAADKKYCVAITGCAGSGKSTALKILAAENFFVLDFDSFSRKIIAENSCVHKKLSEIIREDVIVGGKFDFKKVGAFFEKHPTTEKIFEQWYQPLLGQEIKHFLATENCRLLFADVPFLQQKKILALFDELWIIETDFNVCFRRIAARNNYLPDKIKYLIERSQVSEELYCAATRIINNDTTLENFRQLIKVAAKEVGYNV